MTWQIRMLVPAPMAGVAGQTIDCAGWRFPDEAAALRAILDLGWVPGGSAVPERIPVPPPRGPRWGTARTFDLGSGNRTVRAVLALGRVLRAARGTISPRLAWK